MDVTFEWDNARELENRAKHGYSFKEAVEVFRDPKVIHLEDERHSSEEDRYYAIGKIRSGVVLTVRYTKKGDTIRIFGVANWRKWRKFYEQNT